MIEKTLLISHRGNTTGPSPDYENNPAYVNKTLSMGYDVEIDVWMSRSELYLGHDSPDYKVNIDFLKRPGLWCHAKSLEALSLMVSNNIHCFWHNTDDYTLTSQGKIWSSPDSIISENCIWVMPEKSKQFIERKIVSIQCIGVCSDIVKIIESEIDNRRAS
jgi:hypothetical protein